MTKRAASEPREDLRGVALIRMSDQKQENSPERQRVGFADWCARYDVTPVGEYDDMGISATKTKMVERPGIMRMWVDAGDNKFDVVWAEETSRATRDMIETLQLQEHLQALHIPFLDGKEDPRAHYDPTIRKIITAIKGGLAEVETKRLSLRIKGTLDIRARAGEYCGQIMPPGYTWTKADGITIDDAQAQTARRVFEIFVETGTYNSVAKRLNAEGLVGKKGRPFSAKTVIGVLKSPAYRGKCNWHGDLIDIPAPELIDPATLAKTDRLLGQIIARPQRVTKAKSTFAGLVRCPACHGWMSCNQVWRNAGDGHAIRCQNAYRHPRTCTNTRTTRETVLERALLPQIIGKLRQRANDIAVGTQPQKKASQIETTLARLEEATKREKMMYSNQLRTWDELQARLTEIDATKAELLSQKVERPRVSAEELRKMARKVERQWPMADAMMKRTMLQAMISHIVLNHDSYADSEIIWLMGR
ncbi:MAG: recombinase family protein [Armatimonadota bacterium]